MAANSSVAAAAAASGRASASANGLPDFLANVPLTPNQLAGVGAATGAALLAYGLDRSFLIRQDIGYIRKMFGVLNNLKVHMKNGVTTADLWEETVRQWPNKTSIVFEGREWSFDALDKYANRVANWLLARGFKNGDVLALLMENRAEYMPIWMGVLKVGGIAALINYNVRGKPLMHSLTISGAKILITGVEQIDCVREIAPQLAENKWSVYSLGQAFDIAPNLDLELARASDVKPPRKVRAKVGFNDSALLVYTSGTTGLPKAATIRHARLYSMGYGFIRMFEVRHDDRIYTVLPLYHSAGGLVGVGMMIFSGATLLLKRKFSASQFWTDTKEQKATVVQYIGELCRYLLGAPPSPNDKQTTVRIAIGNGLRPDIWEQFQTRFNVPEVGEFYGSTEGNAALMNHCKEPRARGSVGRMGPLMHKISKLRLVQFDVLREEPIRDKNGFCIECKAGETGELLGEILEGDPLRQFAGYHGNKEATNKKVARDVFKKGDSYFRTGDLLKVDSAGFWYFVDRIGDTFRWKGENVSTTEVAEAVSTYPGVEEVNVYGVEVPHQDGRACCAAMVLADNIDWPGLYNVCAKNLPSYAVPLFIRKLPKIDITGTFKHQKVELRNQGINPSKCLSDGKQDQLFILDGKNKTYRPFNQPDFDRMVAEKPAEFGAPAQAGEHSTKKAPRAAAPAPTGVVAQSKL